MRALLLDPYSRAEIAGGVASAVGAATGLALAAEVRPESVRLVVLTYRKKWWQSIWDLFARNIRTVIAGASALACGCAGTLGFARLRKHCLGASARARRAALDARLAELRGLNGFKMDRAARQQGEQWAVGKMARVRAALREYLRHAVSLRFAEMAAFDGKNRLLVGMRGRAFKEAAISAMGRVSTLMQSIRAVPEPLLPPGVRRSAFIASPRRGDLSLAMVRSEDNPTLHASGSTQPSTGAPSAMSTRPGSAGSSMEH